MCWLWNWGRFRRRGGPSTVRCWIFRCPRGDVPLWPAQTMWPSRGLWTSQSRWELDTENCKPYGYGSIPIDTIFSGMNIHLPAILMWTTGVQGFDTLPYVGTKTATGLDFLCNFLKQAALPLRLLQRRQICGISIHNTMDFWVWTWGSSWPRSWGIFRQSWMTTLLYIYIYMYVDFEGLQQSLLCFCRCKWWHPGFDLKDPPVKGSFSVGGLQGLHIGSCRNATLQRHRVRCRWVGLSKDDWWWSRPISNFHSRMDQIAKVFFYGSPDRTFTKPEFFI